MSIWITTPVEEVPEIVLREWRICEVSSKSWPEKTRHFVGYNVMESEGRVSSEIVEFDPKTMCGKTRSGRVYRLEGPSDYNRDAAYTWARWCRINNISEVKEIKIEQTLDIN
jgi:hypothetical protein